MTEKSHSILPLLERLEEALTDAPWFYEAGIPEGGDRTGSVWARPNEALTLVMNKPHVLEAERLVLLRNALPEVIAELRGLEEQLEVYQKALEAIAEGRNLPEQPDRGSLSAEISAAKSELAQAALDTYPASEPES